MFIGCCKAFDSFLKLYLAEKEAALRELILVEPDCVRLIKEHSELGVMSGSILWDRALQKVTNIELQSKIQRIYHIFQNMPVSI